MKGKIILLVEDNRDDEELTLRALKKNNITNQVVVARDGAQALDYFFARGEFSARDKGALPAVTLLDLKLPKVDGLEVLKQVRTDDKTKSLPIVILSSSKEDQDILSSYESGANSYIRKPVDFTKFTQAIAQLGSYWLELNEAVPEKIAS
jgi:two-component system response regulator